MDEKNECLGVIEIALRQAFKSVEGVNKMVIDPSIGFLRLDERFNSLLTSYIDIVMLVIS